MLDLIYTLSGLCLSDLLLILEIPNGLYSVGNGVPILLLFRRLLPQTWFRAIVQRSLG